MTTITSRQIAFIEKLQADKAYIAQFDYNAPSYRSAIHSMSIAQALQIKRHTGEVVGPATLTQADIDLHVRAQSYLTIDPSTLTLDEASEVIDTLKGA